MLHAACMGNISGIVQPSTGRKSINRNGNIPEQSQPHVQSAYRLNNQHRRCSSVQCQPRCHTTPRFITTFICFRAVMRQFIGIKTRIRWPGQPSIRYRSSWTSRKLDFGPTCKSHPAHQSNPKAAATAPAAPFTSLDDARRILKEKFGHDAFRPEQETVVSQLLAGRNVLLQWPDHSGRSTAYLVCLFGNQSLYSSY